MSYPVQYCPFCEREISNPGIRRAIQEEKEIWRPTEFEPDSCTKINDSFSATVYLDGIPYEVDFD